MLFESDKLLIWMDSLVYFYEEDWAVHRETGGIVAPCRTLGDL